MPKCQIDVTAADVSEYIAKLIPQTFQDIMEQEGACVVRITPQWSIIYSALAGEIAFNISAMRYYTIPKLYGLMDTTSMDAAGITSTLNQPFLNVAGQGVIIGLVDTGIDYMSDSFKDSAGFTRVSTIWDQTLPNQNNDVLYGRAFFKEDINRAIQAADRGEDPYAIVPTKDDLGHGTFLAGVMAASQTKTYKGAAPQAELAVVKLKQAKKYLRDFYLINDEAAAFAETDIMMGVKYLVDYANSVGKPLVLLCGLGTASGSRTGIAPLDEQLNVVAARKNTAVVTGMGNEATNRTHYEGIAASGQIPDSIEINVDSAGKGFAMEIWADSLDVLSVSIVSPSGEQIPRIPARVGQNSEFAFILEQSRVTVDYQSPGLAPGAELIFIRFITPAEGIWKVNVFSLTNIEGRYNAWLPLEVFMSSKVNFVRSNPYITLNGPSAASRVISVGAYDHVTGADAPFSGRGFAADGRVKPDLIAPGVNVYGPVPGNRFTNMSGTSIGAAHVAGAAALLLCWGVYYNNAPLLSSSDIKVILLRGAYRENGVSYPNRISGYGKLNLINSFYQMRIT